MSSKLAKRRKRTDTNQQGQEGVAWVRWVVEGLWRCGLEVVSAHNDDGVDAMLLLKRRSGLRAYAGPTGDLVFLQIKTGYVKKPPSMDYSLNLGKEHIDLHRARWAAYPGPAIMINVIPRRLTKGTPVAYWADLKSDAVTDSGKVNFRVLDTFDAGAKADFFNLCWRWAEFRQLPLLKADTPLQPSWAEPSMNFLREQSLHAAAHAYYQSWMEEARKTPKSFQAHVTRRGWNHITRLSRPNRTKQQSLQLLPVAARMLSSFAQLPRKRLSAVQTTALPHGQERRRWYEGVTSRVSFYERHEAVVRVIVECTELSLAGVLKQKSSCFYSVFEVARRKSSP